MDTQNKNNLKLPTKVNRVKYRRKRRGLALRDYVRTPEDVEKLSKYDVHSFVLPSSYKKKLKYRTRDVSFLEAKKKLIRKFVINKHFNSSWKRPQLPDISSATPVKRPRLEEPIKYVEKPLSEFYPTKEKLPSEVVAQKDKSDEKPRTEDITWDYKHDEKPRSEGIAGSEKPDEISRPEVIQINKSEGNSRLEEIQFDKSEEKPRSDVVISADKSYEQIRSEGITQDENPEEESRTEEIQIDKSKEKNESQVINDTDKPISEVVIQADKLDKNLTPEVTTQAGKTEEKPRSEVVISADKSYEQIRSEGITQDENPEEESRTLEIQIDKSEEKNELQVINDAVIQANKLDGKLIQEVTTQADKSEKKPRSEVVIQADKLDDKLIAVVTTQADKSEKKPRSEVVIQADKLDDKLIAVVTTQADKSEKKPRSEVVIQADKSYDQPRSEGITKDDKPVEKSRTEVIQVDKSEEKHQSEVINQADKSEESSSSFYVKTNMTSQNENNLKLPAKKFITKLEITERQRGLKLRENVRTMEDVDKLTDKEVCLFNLPSTYRKRWKSLRTNLRSIEARRNVIRDFVIRRMLYSPWESKQLSNRNFLDATSVTPVKRPILGESIKFVEKPTPELVSHVDKPEGIARLEEPIKYVEKPLSEVHPAKEKPTSEVVAQDGKSDEKSRTEDITWEDYKPEEESRTEEIQNAQVAKLKEKLNSLQTDTSENRTRRRRRTRVKEKKKLNSAASTSTSSPEESVEKQSSEQQQELNDCSESEKVIIVLEGFPEVQLDREKHELILQEILEVYENIPMCSETCVAFDKWISTPEYLIIPCIGKYSAQWLKDIIPTLRPWENCFLKVISVDELPNPCVCTVAVSEEFGVQLSAEQILARLSIGNEGLDTDLWSVWRSSTVGQRQIWTFSMDIASLKRLKVLEMRPRCGFKRLRFRYKSTFWNGSRNVTAGLSSGVQDVDPSN